MSHPVAESLRSRDHPLRRVLVDELHVRRVPPYGAPARALQIVMYTGDADAGPVRGHAESLLPAALVPTLPKGRYFRAPFGEMLFVWERHTEFSSYTFVAPGPFTLPFSAPLCDRLPVEWVDHLPGQTIRATHIALMARGSPAPTAAELAVAFDHREMVCADVQWCEARIWSSFQVHDDGFGRLLVHDQRLAGESDTARLVQRLQELGTYRNMALLGLPVAHALGPTLTGLERRLTELTQALATERGHDERLLHELSDLCAELARLSAETSYRMGATRAYAQLVHDRLGELQAQRVPGFQTLDDFTQRRVTPAARTCASFTERLATVSERASWSSSLMRTRIETTLEVQSRDLLASMNRRTRLQMRLQQTVESLSVLAIAYYGVGLLGYALKPLAHLWPWLDPAVALALSAPALVALAWWGLRRVRAQAGAG